VNMPATATAMRHSLRRRTTKLLICTAGVAAVAATAMTTPAAAGVGPLGTGTPLCNGNYNGTITFLPSLVTGGTATSEEVELKMKFNGCTGGAPTPTAGVYIAKGIVTGTAVNACTSWFVAPASPPATSPLVAFSTSAPLYGAVTWSPASITGSHARFTKMRINTSSAGFLAVRLPGAWGTIGGSYAPSVNVTLRTAQNYTAVNSACNSGGLSSLTIVPANPSTSHSTGTW
jgi:hypothetical protein